MPELRALNQNTFFAVSEIHDDFKTVSRCHFVFGDRDDTQHYVDTAGLSSADFETVLKEKISFGLTLRRDQPANDDEREIPIDIVEAHKYVKHMDDG
eukprot:CAMPEP_0170114646 /NCGR_PEP_ID=MMETSP0020_2-20130122/10864_1 /TAXON_ID=98059 /ORGANISM="Dinobryon sp., Strain UTEXLB2267" /LENGTH=96 /DNA_ID=CAMNT_0010341745 /DNA_START=114 /DNA_END=400 /DNA_ORIENTATION=-